MNLFPPQREALGELINIGYGRAAGALSDLTGHRIRLGVPDVDVYLIDEIQQALSEVFSKRVWSVHQFFSGALKGNAVLLTDEEGARGLSRLVAGEELSPDEEARTTGEVLTEIGNIVLQAALGSCGDLLEVELQFSVPGLNVKSVPDLVESVTVRNDELHYALLIRTRFQIVATEIVGYVIVILGVSSFTRLIEALDLWQKRQLEG